MDIHNIIRITRIHNPLCKACIKLTDFWRKSNYHLFFLLDPYKYIHFYINYKSYLWYQAQQSYIHLPFHILTSKIYQYGVYCLQFEYLSLLLHHICFFQHSFWFLQVPTHKCNKVGLQDKHLNMCWKLCLQFKKILLQNPSIYTSQMDS